MTLRSEIKKKKKTNRMSQEQRCDYHLMCNAILCVKCIGYNQALVDILALLPDNILDSEMVVGLSKKEVRCLSLGHVVNECAGCPLEKVFGLNECTEALDSARYKLTQALKEKK